MWGIRIGHRRLWPLCPRTEGCVPSGKRTLRSFLVESSSPIGWPMQPRGPLSWPWWGHLEAGSRRWCEPARAPRRRNPGRESDCGRRGGADAEASAAPRRHRRLAFTRLRTNPLLRGTGGRSWGAAGHRGADCCAAAAAAGRVPGCRMRVLRRKTASPTVPQAILLGEARGGDPTGWVRGGTVFYPASVLRDSRTAKNSAHTQPRRR